jgi:hypothetical protein
MIALVQQLQYFFFGHRDVDNSLLGLNLDQRRREHAAVASGSSS